MSERVRTGRFPPLSVEVQAELAEQYGLSTLFFCPNAWALRHRFVNQDTGDMVRVRCGSWSCLYCGPRKVDMWRQLVKAAEPTLFVTLTQVGKTLKEASRVLTTVLQYLRRGSKGRGKDKVGARPAYPIQVFAVLEEHSDFENVGFHWHLLVKGVDFLPNQVVSDALRSATGGRSYITKVKRVKNNTAVGYVTKYLMKEIAREHRGMVEETQVVPVVVMDAVDGACNEQGAPYLYEVRCGKQGQVIEEREEQTIERLCKAHRIRYSKQFFPESTADLRRRLFGGREEEESEGQEQAEEGSGEVSECEEVSGQKSGDQGDGKAQQGEISGSEDGQEPQPAHRSAWVLYEAEPFIDDEQVHERRRYAALTGITLPAEENETSLEAYKRRCREALREALAALREGKRVYSRRVISIWSYQRERMRLAS